MARPPPPRADAGDIWLLFLTCPKPGGGGGSSLLVDNGRGAGPLHPPQTATGPQSAGGTLGRSGAGHVGAGGRTKGEQAPGALGAVPAPGLCSRPPCASVSSSVPRRGGYQTHVGGRAGLHSSGCAPSAWGSRVEGARARPSVISAQKKPSHGKPWRARGRGRAGPGAPEGAGSPEVHISLMMRRSE